MFVTLSYHSINRAIRDKIAISEEAFDWNHRASYDVHHMTWDDLRLWLDGGCDIGGHSHLHYNMTRLSAREIQETILVNKHLLEEELGIKPRAFAYPYGAFSSAIIDAIRQHYEIAFATEKGSWDASTHRYTINRLTMSPAWNIAECARQLHAIHLDDHTLAETN